MYRSITTRQIENGTKRRNLLAKKCFRPDFFLLRCRLPLLLPLDRLIAAKPSVLIWVDPS